MYKVYTDIWTGPFSFTHPHGRAHASSTMISPDELLIHGGCLSGALSGGPCPAADSWIYSYSKNRWEKVDASCISPRKHSSMASIVSDGFRKSAVIFSGQERDKTLLKVILNVSDLNCLLPNVIYFMVDLRLKWNAMKKCLCSIV